MSDSSRWFPPLEPPPGGRARLVAALAPHGDSDLTPRQAAFACVLLLVMGVLPLAVSRSVRTDPVAEAIVQAAPLAGRDGALAVPTGDAGVRLYLVVASEPAR